MRPTLDAYAQLRKAWRENYFLDMYLEDSNGCWIFQGNINPSGYGRVGRRGLAHRFFYEKTIGPIPEGLQLDHLCRVTRCVNPAHLEPVTAAENLRRSREARANA